MDFLPPELLPFIFVHLPLKDLSKCRMVSKKFRFYVDKIKLSELFINDKNELLSCLTKWSHTNEPINFLNKIDISDFKFLNSFTFNLDHLKRLIINFNSAYKYFDVHFINDLVTLEHLEIWYLGDVEQLRDAYEYRLKFKLPYLKVLYLGFICLPILIDCPEIEFLFYFKEESNFSLVQISHPESVKYLEFDLIEDEMLEKFKNIEFLKCTCSHLLNQNVLTILPCLKQINCDQEQLVDKEDYDQLVQTMNHLIEEKTNLFKEEVQIYFRTVKLLRTKKFEKYGFFSNLEIRSLN